MTGNEPLLLYTGQQQLYSLFSWRESDSESFFGAIRGEKARLELTRALRSVSGEEKIRIAAEQLNKNGGMLISATRDQGGGYRLVRRTQDSKSARARGYLPPTHCQVFAPGGTVESRSLTAGEFTLAPFQYALVPVDEGAETQLRSTVRELDNLPGDLRAEMFHALTGHAGSRAAVHDLKEDSLSAKSSLAWIWIAMALVLGLAAGCVGSTVYSRKYSADGRAQIEKAQRHAALDPVIRDFDAAMKQSAFPVFKTLYDFHLSPLLLAPSHGVTASSLESWMLLKVALFRSTPPVDSGSGVLPSTFNWSVSSNQEAKADFAKKDSLTVPDENAVRAATCLDGAPSAAFATPDDCSHVDWKGAPGDLKALLDYVKKSSGTSPPQAGTVVPQVQPEKSVR